MIINADGIRQNGEAGINSYHSQSVLADVDQNGDPDSSDELASTTTSTVNGTWLEAICFRNLASWILYSCSSYQGSRICRQQLAGYW